jgi:ATP-dependent Lon protease
MVQTRRKNYNKTSIKKNNDSKNLKRKRRKLSNQNKNDDEDIIYYSSSDLSNNSSSEIEHFPTDSDTDTDDEDYFEKSLTLNDDIFNKKDLVDENSEDVVVLDFGQELLKKITGKYEELLKKDEEDEKKIFDSLNEDDKKKLELINTEIENFNKNHIPNKIQFLLSDHIDISTKALYKSKIDTLKVLEPGLNEHKKTKDWVEALESIPFGIYNKLPCEPTEIPSFLKDIKTKLDNAVYGHKEVKETFIEIITKWITNNNSNGNIIGLVGSPGTGKTSIIREGLSKALNRPFCSLSLSGFNDENYLCGFASTYEGSTYGKMVKMLIDAKCMNPIIFMDELDKIDNTRNGNNIANKLIEITDTSQNHEFEDFYLSGVKIDLSKCLFVFSMNNIHDVNPILRDRIEIIKVNGFNNTEKKTICKKYIIPRELKDMGLKKDDIIFTDNIIEYIISKIPKEDGVRTLKKTIQKIIRKINVIRFLNSDNDLSYYIKNIILPYQIRTKDVENFMKNSTQKESYLNMYC